LSISPAEIQKSNPAHVVAVSNLIIDFINETIFPSGGSKTIGVSAHMPKTSHWARLFYQGLGLSLY
jgi:hypothetical protein